MSKLFLIAFLLMGCASGSEVELEEVPATEVLHEPSEAKPAPVQEEVEPAIDCKINRYRDGGCITYKFICEGFSTRTETLCPLPSVWPWEMEPMPVIYGN